MALCIAHTTILYASRELDKRIKKNLVRRINQQSHGKWVRGRFVGWFLENEDN